MSQVYAPPPPLGFYFKVFFEGITEPLSFQSVSGLSTELVTESYREGGQAYSYELPVKIQYPTLVLKRGLVPSDNAAYADWVRNPYGLMYSLTVSPATVTVSLLSPLDVLKPVLMTWRLTGAWVKKYSFSDFNAEENQVVIETMELHYDYFEIVPDRSSALIAQPE